VGTRNIHSTDIYHIKTYSGLNQMTCHTDADAVMLGVLYTAAQHCKLNQAQSEYKHSLTFRILAMLSQQRNPCTDWTHTLRPFYGRPIKLTQEGRTPVNDVWECVRD